MHSNKYEGKTYEEALDKCLKDLEEKEENLYIVKSEKDGSLFKSKKIELEVYKKSDIYDFIKNFIKEMSSLMNIESNVEIRNVEDVLNIQIISNNNQILIGKDGKILNSIQMLLRQALSNRIDYEIKINLDIANYKNKKLKRIEREIRKIAEDVRKSKIEVSLDPMNSYERRYVHCIITDYEELETESFGEGAERHVVIKYAKK